MSSYSDKKDGTIFPTRTGVAQGAATERSMLDKTGEAIAVQTVVAEAGGTYAATGQAIGLVAETAVCGGTYELSGSCSAFTTDYFVAGGEYTLSGAAVATFFAPSYIATMGGRYILGGNAWGPVVWVGEGGGKYKLSGGAVANPGSVIVGGGAYRMAGAGTLQHARLTAGAGRYQLAGRGTGYHGIAGHGGGLYALSGGAALATKTVQSLFAGGAYRLRGSCVANTPNRPFEDTTIFTISKQRVIHVVV